MTLEYAPQSLLSQTPLPIRGGDILACGFAMTVAAWITAYISRLPMVNAPGQVTVLAMLAVIFLGGILTARYAAHGLFSALAAGAISGLLNNLIVGSVLHDVASKTAGAPATAPGASLEVPAVAFWVIGSMVCNILVAGAGGFIGRFFLSPNRGEKIRWVQIFAIVLAAATLPLLAIGGLVTALRAGMAVPDWPQSYGYNMFLFPLSKMQSNQGDFYEHAHRLMGFLVGLTALALAIYATIAEKRPWIKILAWAIGCAIALQAVLGGTRVIENNLDIALAHGVFAQVVFSAMVCLAAGASTTFASHPATIRPSASFDRVLSLLLVASLIIQLILGGIVRVLHVDSVIMLHITMAVVVTFVALAAGIRAWGLNPGLRPVRLSGIAILALVVIQLILGVLALAFRSTQGTSNTTTGALLTTAHQANGALLLAASALLALWTWRLLAPDASRHPATSPSPSPPYPPNLDTVEAGRHVK